MVLFSEETFAELVLFLIPVLIASDALQLEEIKTRLLTRKMFRESIEEALKIENRKKQCKKKDLG